MKVLKTILVFILCMLLYFIPALLFKSDPAYYPGSMRTPCCQRKWSV